jgi:hypothetical protein
VLGLDREPAELGEQLRGGRAGVVELLDPVEPREHPGGGVHRSTVAAEL